MLFEFHGQRASWCPFASEIWCSPEHCRPSYKESLYTHWRENDFPLVQSHWMQSGHNSPGLVSHYFDVIIFTSNSHRQVRWVFGFSGFHDWRPQLDCFGLPPTKWVVKLQNNDTVLRTYVGTTPLPPSKNSVKREPYLFKTNRLNWPYEGVLRQSHWKTMRSSLEKIRHKRWYQVNSLPQMSTRPPVPEFTGAWFSESHTLSKVWCTSPPVPSTLESGYPALGKHAESVLQLFQHFSWHVLQAGLPIQNTS